MKRLSRTSQQKRRRGFMSMELAMTLPIWGLLLMGLFEFSLLFFARGSVVEASRFAARKATFRHSTQEDIEDEVRKVLSPQLQRNMEIITRRGQRTGDIVSVVVRVPMNAASPDLLWPIGFSLEGQSIVGETRMIRE